MISGLETVFAPPEEYVVKQDSESDAMYFIQQGDCTVDIINEKREVMKTIKLLIEGAHFGELGLIYDCPRSASVISRNYNQMARLSKLRFIDVRGNFPEFEKLLKKHIFLNYRGTRKMFIYKILL